MTEFCTVTQVHEGDTFPGVSHSKVGPTGFQCPLFWRYPLSTPKWEKLVSRWSATFHHLQHFVGPPPTCAQTVRAAAATTTKFSIEAKLDVTKLLLERPKLLSHDLFAVANHV